MKRKMLDRDDCGENGDKPRPGGNRPKKPRIMETETDASTTRAGTGTGTEQSQGKDKRIDLTPKSILFVPRSARGELVARLREGEKKLWPVLQNRIKIVEQGGKTLRSVLLKKNPWDSTTCGRTRCRLCKDGQTSSSYCKVRSVIYENR